MAPPVAVESVTTNPIHAASQIGAIPYESEDITKCVRCSYVGCDLKVSGCGCSYHARCCPVRPNEQIKTCPYCNRETNGLILYPMSFIEVDEARKAASIAKFSSKLGRKRKNSMISESDSGEGSGIAGCLESPNTSKINREKCMVKCRTGRWTAEEKLFCDKLIHFFKDGQLPLEKGIKLNDFLTSILKSKQSRLTKKMKNAKLSSVTFKPASLYIMNDLECREFSSLEYSFFNAIQDAEERAELKFHMRKEWCEMFCSTCINIGWKLDADSWLSSIDEAEKRISVAQHASRMQRRKVMMGNALCYDSRNAESGVFIESTISEMAAARANDLLMKPLESSEVDEFTSLLSVDQDDGPLLNITNNEVGLEMNGKSSVLHSSPFLNKVAAYVKRRNVPFEHVDIWVPSLIATDTHDGKSKCRLSFAGSATIDAVMAPSAVRPEPISLETQFGLLAFGDYSQKFSFDVGSGLPGRVYETGISAWEQNVQIAPNTHFERCGGALQWGIKTVLGIPVVSPNVGRVIIVLYSVHNRVKCENLVAKLKNEFIKLLPTPKWKLVVDVSSPPEDDLHNISTAQVSSSTNVDNDLSCTQSCDSLMNNVIRLLGDEMPSNSSPNVSVHVQSLMSLRLLLLRSKRSPEEDEIVNTILGSYSSYSKSDRPRSDIAIMLAHDFVFLTQSQKQNSFNSRQIPMLHHHNAGTQAELYSQERVFVPNESHEPLPSTNVRLPLFDGSLNASVKAPIHITDVPLDPKFTFFSSLDDVGPSATMFRPNSPALTPIISPGDSLSIVSN